MRFLEQRQELVDGGNNLLNLGLTKGTGGNLSIFIREEKLMLITPSGIEYPKLKPEDMVLMDLNGNVVEGDLKPSSEHRMHSIIYENRDDIDAVVHSHTTSYLMFKTESSSGALHDCCGRRKGRSMCRVCNLWH